MFQKIDAKKKSEFEVGLAGTATRGSSHRSLHVSVTSFHLEDQPLDTTLTSTQSIPASQFVSPSSSVLHLIKQP